MTAQTSSDTTEGADDIIDTDDDEFLELEEQDKQTEEQIFNIDKPSNFDKEFKNASFDAEINKEEPYLTERTDSKPSLFLRCNTLFKRQDTQNEQKSPILLSEESKTPTHDPKSQSLVKDDPKSPIIISPNQESTSQTLKKHDLKSPSLLGHETKSPTLLSQDTKSQTMFSRDSKSPTLFNRDSKSPTWLNRDATKSPASETRSECEVSVRKEEVEITSRNRRLNTDMNMLDVEYLIGKLESLLKEVNGHQDAVDKFNAKISELTEKLTEKEEATSIEKMKQLEAQNVLLREKSVEARKENDILVEKIQNMHTRLSTSAEIRVSVSEIEDTPDPEDPFFIEVSVPEPQHTAPVELPGLENTRRKKNKKDLIDRSLSYTAGGVADVECSAHNLIIRSTEKKYEDAVEKIMRLEQRIVCLQNANNLNSCATCRPLRKHVMKIERQLLSLVQERKSQLEELFQLKQVALSSAVSEKDAHLAWLEATGEGNVHTLSSIEKLRKERRDILNRMKDENENRMKLLAKLEENPTLFTGPAKLSAIGALGDNFGDEEFQSTSSIQSSSIGDLGDIQTNPIFLLSPSDTPPQGGEDQINFTQHHQDNDSVKSF